MTSSPGTKPAHQVLIVDDNDDIRDAMAEVLRVQGYRVAPAWSVEDALRQLRQGVRPCVVLLDLQMPSMDEFAFLDRIRIEPHLADVPVIIVSGHQEEEARAREHACEFLFKPVDPRA